MIISHTRKFIFVKSTKTVGTSIEAALSNYCGGDDVVTLLNNYAFNRDEKSPTMHWAMNADELGWWNREIGQHVDALTMSRLLEEVWKDYLKISIARNPWDRIVSLFFWDARNDRLGVMSLGQVLSIFSHRFSIEFELVGVVYEAVE